jgi:predicted nucleotidyltransferase component of viral defense system
MSSARRPTNVAASVRARLLDLSRHNGVEFQLVLAEFAIERLLYRVGVSPYAEQFVLKGAMLFKLWSNDRRRATWDLDLLGRGGDSVAEVVATLREICGILADDGIAFDVDSLVGEEIRAADEYAGVRVRLDARLAEARIPVQVDVGFGDAVVPEPRRHHYPTLLDHEAAHILVYPRESVIAEKCEAMVSLGVTNSLMKDLFDVHALASSFAFDGATLVRAVRATFERRRTPFPEGEPIALTLEFVAAPERQTQWRAFLRKGRLEATPDARQLADVLRSFLLPVLTAAARDESFSQTWLPQGPWRAAGESEATVDQRLR